MGPLSINCTITYTYKRRNINTLTKDAALKRITVLSKRKTVNDGDKHTNIYVLTLTQLFLTHKISIKKCGRIEKDGFFIININIIVKRSVK